MLAALVVLALKSMSNLLATQSCHCQGVHAKCASTPSIVCYRCSNLSGPCEGHLCDQTREVISSSLDYSCDMHAEHQQLPLLRSTSYPKMCLHPISLL